MFGPRRSGPRPTGSWFRPPLLLALLACLLLSSLPAQPASSAAQPPAGPSADLYFLAGRPAGVDGATGAGLYRLAAGSALATAPGAPALLPAGNWDAQPASRLYPAPRGPYLAVVQPIAGSPASRLAVVDTTGQRLLPLDRALAGLSPLGRFAGWHPDGQHVLYSDWYDRSGLWLVDATGAAAPLRLSARTADAAAFAPDGQTLAFTTRDGPADCAAASGAGPLCPGAGAALWLAAGDGSAARPVLTLPAQDPVYALAWSPDGSRLAYVVGAGQLYLLEPGTGATRLLSRAFASGWDFGAPAWSPDGATLAYPALVASLPADEGSANDDGNAWRRVDTHLLDVATGRERPLAPGSTAGDLYPAWSPDGATLAFLSQRSGERQVWQVRPDGSDLHALTAAPGCPVGSAPAWLPASPAAGAAGGGEPAPAAALPSGQPAPSAPSVPAAPGAGVPDATEPFLTTPYYGTHRINSYFDHRYPTYTAAPNATYASVVRYDGQDLPDCSQVAWGTPCLWYDGHDGYDFDLVNQPVVAAAAGQVTWAGWQNPDCQHGPACGYGLYVAVDHGNGYGTRYGHLSATVVTAGQAVRQGQVLGTSGNTGNSTGPHLHFSIHKNYKSLDPFGWTGADADPWLAYAGALSVWLWADGQWAGHPQPQPVYFTYLPLAVRRWPPVPDVPVLSAIAAPAGQPGYTVSWNAAYLATSYVLQEATNADFTDAVQLYAGAATSYTVASRGMRSYYYRVRAHNQWGDSAWSDVGSVAIRWETEPNNTFAQANSSLLPGLAVYGYPNDSADYFRFDLQVTGTITVDLTGDNGGGVQLALYRDAGGAAPVRVARDVTAPFHLSYTGQPGPYYVYIYTGWSYNRSKSYTLVAAYPVPAPPDPQAAGQAGLPAGP